MEGLKTLNNYLASHTYLVGDKVTVADVIVTCNLIGGFQNVLTAGFLKPFPHVTRYFWTQVNQPVFKKVSKRRDILLPFLQHHKRRLPIRLETVSTSPFHPPGRVGTSGGQTMTEARYHGTCYS